MIRRQISLNFPRRWSARRGLFLLRGLLLVVGAGWLALPPAPAQVAPPAATQPPRAESVPAPQRQAPPQKAGVVPLGSSRADSDVLLGEAERFLLKPSPFLPAINEAILTLAFSPDGTKLVTGGAHPPKPGHLEVWDLATGKETLKLRGISGVRGVAFSPTGTTFATGDFAGTIILRDPATGQVQSVVRGHNNGVNGLAFSPDGKLLASAGLDRTVKVWDVRVAPNLPLQQRRELRGHTGMVFGVAFFPDGQTLVSCSDDRTARIWDLTNGKEKVALIGHQDAIESVAVSPDGKLVATAGWDQTVRLWDAAIGQARGVLQESNGRVYAVAFSPTSPVLACASLDGTVSLWDLQTQQRLRNLDQKPGPQQRAGLVGLLGSVQGQGPLLTAASLDLDGKGAHSAAVWTLAFSPDGKSLATGGSDNLARVWDLATFRNVKSLVTGTPPVTPLQALACSPDGRTVAIAAADRTVQLRDARSGELQLALSGHAGEVTCLAFSPDGRMVASGSRDWTVKLWDRATGQEKQTLKGSPGAVLALAFSPDGRQLATAGDDRAIHLWDPVSGKKLRTLPGHTGAIRALEFARDGQHLASGSSDQTIKVWNLAGETEPITLQGHEAVIRALAYSPTGILASGSEDSLVKLWEPGQGKEPRTLRGHLSGVGALAFTPGGRTLVSGGEDMYLVVWDPVSGQPRQLLQGHQGAITAIAIHPQGGELLSGGQDSIFRWLGGDGAMLVRTMPGGAAASGFVQYSPAGDRLAGSGSGGSVSFWFRGLSSARYPSFSQPGSYQDGAFAPDGRTVALAGSTAVQICDALSGLVRRTLTVGKPVRALAYSPDGQYLAAASGADNPGGPTQIRLFNPATGQELAQLLGPAGELAVLRFAPDSKTLAASGLDNNISVIWLWEVPAGKPRILTGHKELARGLVFLPDGTLASGSWDGTIRFWEPGTLKEKGAWKVGLAVGALAVSPDGTLLAVGEGGRPGPAPGPLRVWELSTGKQLFQLQGHGGRIHDLAFTPDGRNLISAGGRHDQNIPYGEVLLWEMATGRLRGTYRVGGPWFNRLALNQDGKRALAFSTKNVHFYDVDFQQRERSWMAHDDEATCGLFVNNGKVLATGGTDKVIKMWDIARGESIATLLHGEAVRGLALLPDGQTLLSAGDDGVVKRWDLAGSKDKGALGGRPVPIRSLAVSPDGKRLVTGGGDPAKAQSGELVEWDLAGNQPHRVIAAGLDQPVWSVAYSPDGKLFAAALGSGAIEVWDMQTSQKRITLPAPGVRALAFSPDSKLLACGEGRSPTETEPGDGSVILWDTATWQKRSPLQRHQSLIHSVAFSPDGRAVASASQDGTIKLCAIASVRGEIPSRPAADNPVSIAAAAEIKDAPMVQQAQPGFPAMPPPAPRAGGWQPAIAPPGPASPQPFTNFGPKGRSKGWLAASVLLGLVITFAFGIFLYVRQSRKEEYLAELVVEVAEVEPVEVVEVVEPPPSISFSCSECGKSLKARGAFAGKKIRCPRCSKPMLVPGASTAGNHTLGRDKVVRKHSPDQPEG